MCDRVCGCVSIIEKERDRKRKSEYVIELASGLYCRRTQDVLLRADRPTCGIGGLISIGDSCYKRLSFVYVFSNFIFRPCIVAQTSLFHTTTELLRGTGKTKINFFILTGLFFFTELLLSS